MQHHFAKQNLRIFSAVELPDEVRARIAEHTKKLRQFNATSGVRFESTEKLHITLKFFGEVTADRLSELTDAAARAAQQSVSSFELAIEGTGQFPPGRKPRVLWLGIKDALAQLGQLHERFEDSCVAVGFAPEEKQFHPHLTIARLRFPETASELIAAHRATEFAANNFPVHEFVIMRSELTPAGSLYHVLSRHSVGSK